jgi:SAM-dependent methyltransferase
LSSRGSSQSGDPYRSSRGVHRLLEGVIHREEHYDPRAFELLLDMQARHFWYRGRHRFLLHALRRHGGSLARRRSIDLGGGCGGWPSYLLHAGCRFSELALGDSSEEALRLARRTLGERVSYFQVDLYDLRWQNRWDLVFLLDVLEHLPRDEAALREVASTLAPGGLVLATVPALDAFWSWNDEVAGHQRRYDKAGFAALARAAGLRVVDLRYFNFLLSPLLWLSRASRAGRAARLGEAEKWRMVEASHRVPARAINAALAAVFAAETPIGHRLQFPWGTSLLGVLRRDG